MRKGSKRNKDGKNCIQCKICGDVIESKMVHDFKTCSCGACSVDGGLEYLRRATESKESYAELSVTEEITNTK